MSLGLQKNAIRRMIVENQKEMIRLHGKERDEVISELTFTNQLLSDAIKSIEALEKLRMVLK